MAGNRTAPAECDVGLALHPVQAACRRACLIVLETLRLDVSRMVRAVFFQRLRPWPVLPCSWLPLAAAWPWLLLSPGIAGWSLLCPFLFQPMFSRVHLMLSRVRPARLSVEQAVVQRSNLETPPARASQQP